MLNYRNSLKWNTESETNNDYYIVESTTDGVNFNLIGKINAEENSTTSKDYELIDRNPLSKLTYYRLKQVDIDGKFTYHPLISVERATSTEAILYPNPSNEDLNVDLNTEKEGNYIFTFISASGKEDREDIFLSKGYNKLNFDLKSRFSSGFYILKISNEDNSFSSINKFIKK